MKCVCIVIRAFKYAAHVYQNVYIFLITLTVFGWNANTLQLSCLWGLTSSIFIKTLRNNKFITERILLIIMHFFFHLVQQVGGTPINCSDYRKAEKTLVYPAWESILRAHCFLSCTRNRCICSHDGRWKCLVLSTTFAFASIRFITIENYIPNSKIAV